MNFPAIRSRYFSLVLMNLNFKQKFMFGNTIDKRQIVSPQNKEIAS